MNMILVSYSEYSGYFKGVRFIYASKKRKNTMTFSSNTFLFFVFALKIAGFL